MRGESVEAKQRFDKEDAILDTVEGHRNVCEFLKFRQEPYAIMMEYSYFDFNFLEVDKKVSSLEDSFISLMPNSSSSLSQMCCCYAQGML